MSGTEIQDTAALLASDEASRTPSVACNCFPHGPDDPCTCDGCWMCVGRVVGCTCDIAWDCEHPQSARS